ncbi:UNVERIFIED_CONTAM: hypothetical protein Sradi_7296200 [Sesamum radiatum]|uniref:Uncharacterized protein n=1 Tax=Sesamum radiatum TaxID=300843 RepID=A0AAW2IJG9_SESRA
MDKNKQQHSRSAVARRSRIGPGVAARAWAPGAAVRARPNAHELGAACALLRVARRAGARARGRWALPVRVRAADNADG